MAEAPGNPERLFPFILRARKLVVGRDNLFRRHKQLQFVLITTDLSENSRKEILHGFADKPIVQKYTSAELESFFQVKNTKVLGFLKSPLATAIYQDGLRTARINRSEVSE